jgi:hypothetical protein
MDDEAPNASRQNMEMYYIVWIVLAPLYLQHLSPVSTTNDVGSLHSPIT